MNPGIFKNVITDYEGATAAWASTGLAIAQSLFIKLAIIQIAFSAILWILGRKSPNEVLAELLRMILVLSLFFALIVNQQSWIPAIVKSFKMIGLDMAVKVSLDPGNIIQRGISLASTIWSAAWKRVGWGTVGFLFTAGISGAAIFFIFMRIAVEMILTIVGGQMILSAGTIVLGFAGAKVTRQFAERYIAAAVMIGLKLLFLILIVGIGESLSAGWAGRIKSAPQPQLLNVTLQVLAGAFIFYYLALRVPDMAVSMLTGGFNTGTNAGFGSAVIAGTRGITAAARGGVAAGVGADIVKGTSLREVIRSGAEAARQMQGGGIRKAAGFSAGTGAVNNEIDASLRIRTLNSAKKK